MNDTSGRSTQEIEASVRALAETVRRARFAGASPTLELPIDASAEELTARVLAADRLGVPLVIGGTAHNLHEERASEELRAAQMAHARWGFAEADARLDRASAMALDPVLQQRIGLWKVLGALARRLVRADPDEPFRGDAARPALELLDDADRLSEAERSHYRDEVRRIVAAHAAARDDAGSVERALWYVVRTRLTLAADEPLAALAWCVRLGRLYADRLPADPYLAGLLAQARQYALLVLGELDDEAAAVARETTRGLQAWDVFRALAAHLGPALGVDLQREASRFTITPYHDADA